MATSIFARTDAETFAKYSVRQLFRALQYERQFAGVPGTQYNREECQKLASEIRTRQIRAALATA